MRSASRPAKGDRGRPRNGFLRPAHTFLDPGQLGFGGIQDKSSARLRARSATRAGLRHTISRSPGLIGTGNLGEIALVESDSCSGPHSAAHTWICGGRSAVI